MRPSGNADLHSNLSQISKQALKNKPANGIRWLASTRNARLQYMESLGA
jgi:hypothetical protein